ncbi:UNVERIFIED_CONTAM: CRISPR-associated endonuclease Cas2 [Campylobacter lari]
MIEVYSRFMRLIVMYDVSFETDDDIRRYNHFRNELIKIGYVMMQFSIYVKCISSHTVYESEKQKIIKILPPKSNIRFFMITESQYQNIELLNGKKSLNEQYNNMQRYVEI